MFDLKLRTRLTACLLAILVLTAGVSAFAAREIFVLGGITQNLRDTWLPSARRLGEITDSLSEIRISEGYHLLGLEGEARKLSLDRIAAIEDLRAAYSSSIRNEDERTAYRAFESAWQAYSAEHTSFMSNDAANELLALANYDSNLKRLYEAADAAGDLLLDFNQAGAKADGDIAVRVTREGVVGFGLVALMAMSLGAILLFIVRNHVTRPLTAITQALTSLAAGDLNVRVPGTQRRDEIGDMVRALEVFRENALELERAHVATEAAHQRAQALARHDALTGLPNRRVFAEDLNKAFARAERTGGQIGVLLIDLDRFKPVNDMYGHASGDIVLCEVANRLKGVMRSNETASRLGGDEFAAIIEFETGTEAPIRFAERILTAISKPITIDGTIVDIGATIGISVAPVDGSDVDALVRASDIAMYRGKKDGRGRARFFEPSMDTDLRSRIALEVDLRRAVLTDEIVPYYQPLVSLADNELRGYEILARWEHPQQGLIQPISFISVAEDIGVIGAMTYRLLRHACTDAQNWPKHLRLSLNVSPVQLKDPELPQRLLEILRETRFAPDRLEVEITESALISDLEGAKVILAALQKEGVSIALDDFGTGYSSLYHLRELHFDKIKIDRSFVQSLRDNPESGKIVDAIISLSKSLNLPATAEGIEDEDLLRRIVETGCEYGQGYWFGKPMTSTRATELAWSYEGKPSAKSVTKIGAAS